MKKFKFLFGALLLASTSVMTSCFSNDIPSIVINGGGGNNSKTNDGVEVGQVTQTSNYTYTIQCNVAADIRVGKSYDKVQKVSSTSSYTGKGGIGEKIYIVASTTVTGYSADEVKKSITLDSNGKVIVITFPKNPSEATSADANFKYAIPLNEAMVRTADGSEISIENTEANKKEPYSKSTTDVHLFITNPMTSTAISKGTPGEALYSITAKEAIMTGVNSNMDDVSGEWFPVLGLMCKPDGAKFGDNPAKVVVKNKNFESGMVFRCNGAVKDEVALDAAVSNPNDRSVTMLFPHFSDYIIESLVSVEKTGEDSIITQTLLDCKVGNLTYNYYVYSGCKYDYKGYNEFIDKYLEAKFGKYRYEPTGEITISNKSSRATVPYTVSQKVYHYLVKFGELPISVDVYGPEDVRIEKNNAVVYDPTKHSGGAAF